MKNSQRLSKTDKLSNTLKYSQTDPNTPKDSQRLSKTLKDSQRLPKTLIDSQRLSKTLKTDIIDLMAPKVEKHNDNNNSNKCNLERRRVVATLLVV